MSRALIWGATLLFILAIPAASIASQKQVAGALTIEPYVVEVKGGEKITAELGKLVVPENRKNGKSNLIELAFVRLKSTANKPGPPVVYLEGGPGGSGIGAAKSPALPLLLALREIGDVILLDQRGTGLSKPALVCSKSWDFPLDAPGDPRLWIRLAKEKLQACAEQFTAQGIDLGGYNTNESADDLETLRQALGIKKVNLWGISYGTHLALVMMRRHPDSVERAVLTGVNGPDHLMMKLPSTIDEQLVKIEQLFKADAVIGKALPDFRGLIKDLLARLEDKPVTVEIANPRTQQKQSVALGRWDLQFHTASPVTQTWSIMSLPAFYYAMSQGDFTPLGQRAVEFRTSQVGSMMAWMMLSSSGVSSQRYRRIERESKEALLGNSINFPFPEITEALGKPDLGTGFRAPITSKTPVLFVSGTLDGRTPPANAEEVKKGFPNGVSITVEGASHGYDLFYFAPGLKDSMLDFFKGQPIKTAQIKMGDFQFRPIGPKP